MSNHVSTTIELAKRVRELEEERKELDKKLRDAERERDEAYREIVKLKEHKQ